MLSPELLKKVRNLHIKTNHTVNSAVAGNYHSAFRGKGMQFQEVRPYVAGDDIRDIDWNVTARIGDPFVKIFHEERELTVMLLADMSASGIFGSQGYLKRNLIAEIAAVLAFSAIKNNDKVGLILFTDKVEKVLLPKKGRGHVWQVIREILNFQSTSQKTDLNVTLLFFNRVMQRRCVAFLISDFLDDSNYTPALRVAAQRHDFIGISVADPLEHQLPNLGLLQVEDPESGETYLINSSDPTVQHQLQLQAMEHGNKIRQLLLSSGATHSKVDCTQDYMKNLVTLFRRRKNL
jgi:uncharacterized protein (DUF58 family)